MTRLDRACVVVGYGAAVLAIVYGLLLLLSGEAPDVGASAWGIAGYLFARSVQLEHRLRQLAARFEQVTELTARALAELDRRTS